MSDFLIGLITVLVYVAVVCTWFFSLFDLFFRGDIGWSKALWLLFIVFVPIFGVLMYWILRPRRDFSEIWVQPTSSRNESLYSQRTDNIAGQVATLAQLRNEGAITDEEFTRMKEKAIA